MPCCSVVGCHNRPERGYKLYKLPQGSKNDARRKLWIQYIGREDPLPQHVYVCQDHFTDDQFELRRADHRKLLKWNAIPTIFSHCSVHKRSSKEVVTADLKHESDNVLKEIYVEENVKSEHCVKTEAEKHNSNNNSDEVAALMSELNASRKEIYILRTVVSQLQEIINILINENDYK